MIVKPISDINFFLEKFGHTDPRSGYVVRWHEKQQQDTFFSPYTFVGNFYNCTVHSTPPLLITEEKQMVTDHVWPLLWQVKHKPQKTHSLWREWGNNINLNIPTVSKNFNDENTYIWMPIDEQSCNNPWHVWIDIISKLRLISLKREKHILDYVYIFPCIGEYLTNVLKEIYPKMKYYVMPKNCSWQFKNLLVPSMSNHLDGETQPESINWLRDQKKNSIEECGPSKKIVITRSDASSRRLSNQQELLLALVGFEPIELSKHTIKQQMQICHEATHIVSTHGAGLVNLLWAQSGTKVVEITHDLYNKKVYPILSYHCGHNHKILIGEKVDLHHEKKISGIKKKNDGNIKININEVLKLL